MPYRITLFCCLLAAGLGLEGCAGIFAGQAPAPLYHAGSPVYSVPAPIPPPQPAPPAESPQEPEIAQTKPLETPHEQSTIPLEALPEPPPLEQPAVIPGQTDISNAAGMVYPDQASVPPSEIVPPQPPPPPAPMAFEPLQSFSPLSPAVGALVLAANKDSQKGSYDTATTTLERAIRIEPRNAALYYKLAVIKLDQSKPRLAEDLAKKALSLVGKDNQLKKHCWLLIAKARSLQQNEPGAKEALDKAEKL